MLYISRVILTSLIEDGMIDITMQGTKYKVYLKLGLASGMKASIRMCK